MTICAPFPAPFSLFYTNASLQQQPLRKYIICVNLSQLCCSVCSCWHQLCQSDAGTGLISPACWQWSAKWLCRSWEDQSGHSYAQKLLNWTENLMSMKILVYVIVCQLWFYVRKKRQEASGHNSGNWRHTDLENVLLFGSFVLIHHVVFCTSCKKLWPFCTFIWWRILFSYDFWLVCYNFFLLSYNFSPAFFSGSYLVLCIFLKRICPLLFLLNTFNHFFCP